MVTLAASEYLGPLAQGWRRVKSLSRRARWTVHWFSYDGVSLCRVYRGSDHVLGEIYLRLPAHARACATCAKKLAAIEGA